MYSIKKPALAALVWLCAMSAYSVPVHINSGNPAFPFPQFLEYACGENLGTKNPEGVVHIEMEQDIRDAYQIFANEWEYSGETMDGVKYIRGNIGCPYDCREGDGYSMLAAAVMGDKVSFDGLWFKVHDQFRPTATSYLTGQKVTDGGYGNLIIGDQANSCSATDGDNEIVMALYIAWRQWGDDSGHKAANGEMISYKKDMIEVMRGLVAMYEERYKTENPRRVTTGDVGLDGYLKNGTTWPEVTNWGSQNPLNMNGVDYIPEYAGPVNMHTDYSSPAYFREFYDLMMELDLPESSEWEREQYRRCEASCDWMVGNWLAQSAKNLFFGEEATISANNVVTMEAGNQGGRFRSAWRTALNYVWHLNPEYTWDPVSHTVKDGGNTFEKDWCDRFAKFMNDPQGWDNAACTEFGGGPSLSYKGPSTLHWDIGPDGSVPKSEFIFNWISGVGMPAAIGSGDMDLAGILYRQCNIEWDITEGGDGYLTSKPHYFHGFFRWLGMLIATGNHQAPGVMKPSANLKIYRAIQDSVTYAYTGDEITYLLDYRNFGVVDAENVVIVENVPQDFVFVSASDGGVYDAANHTITWNIGTLPGFKSDDGEGPALDLKSGNLAKTIGQVSYKCKIGPNASGRYCTTADISCSNGSGWTTNEYPNYTTATMQRNCVDVTKRSLLIEKTANMEKVNPGNLVTYTINFENSSEAGWLDGGRPRVNIGFSHGGLATTQEWLRFRLYNDAIEPYINYGNYRISYYMYDSNLKCLNGSEDCNLGWGWYTAIYEGKRTADDQISVSHETIVEGSDEYGKWNQRMMLQFAPLLVTTTAHLSNYYGMGARIHRGGTEPLRVAGYIYPSNWAATDFSDDWSWAPKAQDAEDGNYHPVTPSWQVIDQTTGESQRTEVTEYLPSVCEKPTVTVPNILVEEYDGYVWRRILGTGPMAGREAKNVVVIDTLPEGLTFVEFKNSCPLTDYGASWDASQIADGRWVVKWEIPVMQIKQKGSIIYTAEANFPSGKECQTDDEVILNQAWISADKNSPLGDTVSVTVTCAKVPDPIIPTTLKKSADKESYSVGDEISYTIEYEQTHGFVTDNATANASEWTMSGASIKDGTVAISDKTTARYNYSYASNIYVEFDCDVTQYASSEVFFRDGIRLDFKPDWAEISLSCYDGATLKKKAAIVANSTKFRLCIDLTDDILRLWFDKDTTNSADFTAEGLSTKPGYFGFKGIEAGSYSYSNIHVHTDFAYDLSIIDRKPEEISFVSADNGGKLVGDSIVWIFEQGIDNPIPFGTKYEMTWTGTIDNCSESIINIAYAKLLGHKDNEIMAQAVSGCGSTCPIQSATLSLEDASICEGGKTTLTAKAEPEGNWNYEFFLDKASLGPPSPKATVEVSDSGSYTVVVSDPSDASCTKESKAAELTVNPVMQLVISPLEPFCAGDAAEFLSDPHVKWFASADTTKAPISSDLSGLEGRLDPYVFFYTFTTDDGCVSGPEKFEVTVKLTASAKFDTAMACGETTIAAEVFPLDAKTTWTLGGDVVAAPSSFTEPGDLGELSLTATAAGYCDSPSNEDNKKSVRVMASAEPPIPADMEFLEFVKGTGCQKVDAKEGAEIKPHDADNLLLWYDAGQKLIGPDAPCHDLSVRDDGTAYFVSEVTPEGCESERMRFVVKVNDAPRPTVLSTTLCEGASLTADELRERVVAESADFEVRWYTAVKDGKGDGDFTAAPTALADAKVGKYEYFVSQHNKVTDAESDVDTLTITVVGVQKPVVASAAYCAGDAAAPLSQSVTATKDEAGGYYQDGFAWFVDGAAAAKGEPVVDTEVAVTTETVYSVAQTYKIAGGGTCVGDTARFIVKVSKAEVPIVNGSIVYTTGDIADGKLDKSLTEKNPNAVATTAEGNTLVWYDAQKNLLGAEAPTPSVDPAKVAAGEDQTFTYFVKQVDGVCESGLVEVTAVVSATPRPITYNLNLCEGEDLDGRTLDDLVEIDANGGDAAKFTKRWYADAATAGNGTDFTERAPALSSSKTTADAIERKTYYVTQVNADGAESGYSEVIVSVYAKPVLEAVPLEAVCEKAVDLAKAWQVANGAEVTDGAYTLEGAPFAGASANSNGNYAAVGSFTVPSPGKQTTCASEPVALKFRIDSLANVGIKGSANACPGSEVTLTAEYETNVAGALTFEWTGGVADAGAESTKTLPLDGAAGDKHTFGLQVTAGACAAKAADATVEIGNGILEGVITAGEGGNDSIGVAPYPVESGKVTVYSCGSGVTLAADVTATGNDFEWNEVGGFASYSGRQVVVSPTETTTYRLSYTNECEASLEVTVIPAPVTVTAAKSADEVCEGEEVTFSMTYECAETPKLAWTKDGEVKTETPTLTIAQATPADAGVYSFEARNRGCRVSGEIGALAVKPYAKAVQPDGAFTVSRGEDLTITLDVSGNPTPAPEVTWTERGQQTYTGAAVTIEGVAEDHRFDILLDGDGYCQTTITVDVMVDAAAAVALSGDNDKVCLGAAVTLTADTAGTGRVLTPADYSIAWEVRTDGDFAEVPNHGGATTLTITPEADADYRAVVSYKEQKAASEAFAVKVYEPATFTTPADQTICEGGEATLEVADLSFDDAVVEWAEDATITTTLSGASVTAAPTETTRYTFTVSREIGCPVEGGVTVAVTTKPELSLTADTTICVGDKVTLSAKLEKGEGTLQWTDGATGAALAQTASLTVMPETDATYRVSVDGGVCGEVSAEVRVAVGQLPVIDTVGVVKRKTVEITASGGDGSYEYKVGATGEYAADNQIEVLRYTTYDFYVRDGNGCETKQAFTLQAPQISFKPTFTPNGDGTNDQWDVTNLAEAYPDAVVIIYDRYGKKLCEMKASEGSWDGTYNGKPMPATDYWYEVDIDEADKYYVGHFTLLR